MNHLSKILGIAIIFCASAFCTINIFAEDLSPIEKSALSEQSLLTVGSADANAFTEEPAEYSSRLISYLNGISSLSGDFEQVTHSSWSPSSDIYRGQLWVARPHLFRVDTFSPSVQTLVSDGQDFWTYDEDLEQVIVSKLNNDLSQVPLLLFSSDISGLEKAYAISGYSDEVSNHFVLEPLSETSLFRSLVLVFRDGKPITISINATTGQVTTIALSNTMINEDIPAERFEFVAPENVDVIDDRQ
ncbi:MAG: outer membrane lipoprotein chaperone LolA [Pseudomonadales bacterium]|jgi:outer membrane lipoprotein carrier protein